jgi:hypothetical protein
MEYVGTGSELVLAQFWAGEHMAIIRTHTGYWQSHHRLKNLSSLN